jgi:hypothetical protein
MLILPKLLSRRMPALLTRMSTRPQASSACWTMAATAASSVTEAALADGLAAGGGDLGHHGIGLGQVVDHHLGAARGQGQGVRAAEAAAGAGDDGHAAVEAKRHVAHPCWK